MSDNQSNAFEFTVSEISQAVKRTVEDQFGYVRVRGEISGFRGQHSSGHCYFTLKDDAAAMDAVVWKGNYSRLAFKPQEGLEIIATGRLTTYPRSSKYQIVIENIEPAGAGALMALLEERRKKFIAEGLFAPERKKELPYLPRVIGVVTSPTGAVIRDILHRLDDRFPSHVIVWPVRVQGDTCAPEVTAAIDGFNAFPPEGPIPRPDLLIVARGGGSIEDLWGFNEESVVRAVARSAIPVISAVGHETDITLVDYVADRRAPTPTGAAEMAVPGHRHLDAISNRMAPAFIRIVETRRARLDGLSKLLSSVSYHQVLARGFALVTDASGNLVRTSDDVKPGDALTIDVAQGSIAATVSEGRGKSHMNILDSGFAPSEAKIRYLDADYVVVKPGTFVRCAITNAPIPIEDLTYWSVDKQEAYADAKAAFTAYQRSIGEK
eukprot:jgi/Tetstr1/452827/TSEL_039863.t1